MALTSDGYSSDKPISKTFFCQLCEIQLFSDESIKAHIQKHEYMNLERRVCCTNLKDIPWDMLCLMEMFNPMDDSGIRSEVSLYDVFMASRVLKDFLVLALNNQFQYLWKEEAKRKLEDLKIVAKMVCDNTRNRLRIELENYLCLPSVIVGEVLLHLLKDAIYEHGKEGSKLIKFQGLTDPNTANILKDSFRFMAKAFDKIRTAVGDACGRCPSRNTFSDIWIPDLDGDDRHSWISYFSNNIDYTLEVIQDTSNLEEQRNHLDVTPELLEISQFEDGHEEEDETLEIEPMEVSMDDDGSIWRTVGWTFGEI